MLDRSWVGVGSVLDRSWVGVGSVLDRSWVGVESVLAQGSKLMLANSQNASDFDNLRVRKTSTSKSLRVRIIHVSQTKGKNLLVEKFFTSKTLQVH